jgi:hypothetical protein
LESGEDYRSKYGAERLLFHKLLLWANKLNVTAMFFFIFARQSKYLFSGLLTGEGTPDFVLNEATKRRQFLREEIRAC